MPRIIEYSPIEDFTADDGYYFILDSQLNGTKKIPAERVYFQKMNSIPISGDISGFLVKSTSNGNVELTQLKPENISEKVNNLPDGYTLKGNELICYDSNGKIILFIDPNTELPLLANNLLKKPSSYINGHFAVFNNEGQLVSTSFNTDSLEDTSNKVNAMKKWANASANEKTVYYASLTLLDRLEFIRNWNGQTFEYEGETYQINCSKTDLANRNPFSVLYFKNVSGQYKFMKCASYVEDESNPGFIYIKLEDFGGGDIPSNIPSIFMASSYPPFTPSEDMVIPSAKIGDIFINNTSSNDDNIIWFCKNVTQTTQTWKLQAGKNSLNSKMNLPKIYSPGQQVSEEDGQLFRYRGSSTSKSIIYVKDSNGNLRLLSDGDAYTKQEIDSLTTYMNVFRTLASGESIRQLKNGQPFIYSNNQSSAYNGLWIKTEDISQSDESEWYKHCIRFGEIPEVSSFFATNPGYKRLYYKQGHYYIAEDSGHGAIEHKIITDSELALKQNIIKTISEDSELSEISMQDLFIANGHLYRKTSSASAIGAQESYNDSTKQNKTTIINKNFVAPPYTLQLDHNNEYRISGSAPPTLTLTMKSTLYLEEDYISSLVFSTGSTPTVLTYDSTIKWSGDDINDGDFTPVANKRYNVIFWYDGYFVNAVVSGVDII